MYNTTSTSVSDRTLWAGHSLTINVNVSPRQLCDPSLVGDVEAALAESGLDPAFLALEVTESSIMGNSEQMLATLDRLKAMNVRLEIDDFGTGYSSLSYLQRLPFDTLKIDRSFIRDLAIGNDSADVVKAIVEMAHSLKLSVIAEGVETQDQLHQVRRLGCNCLQGFLFSKPLDAETAKQLCISGLLTRDIRSDCDVELRPAAGITLSPSLLCRAG
jgi:EAL domain-containing protein (putative c-di-GMP-specific phosphodiesterase class I)